MIQYDALYEFTSVGLDLYRKVFAGELEDHCIPHSDRKLSTLVPDTAPLVVPEFETAGDMADSVLAAFGDTDLQKMLSHTGLWAWLTFVLRDQLFRRKDKGKLVVGELHRWYPSDPNDWLKGQRHLVRMPVVLRHSFGNSVDHLLCNKPSVLPEIREQLTSQQSMFSEPFQQASRALYFDEKRGRLKRGAAGKGAGSARRLAKVRLQLEVTWDLEELDYRAIIDKLPSEFDRFKTTV